MDRVGFWFGHAGDDKTGLGQCVHIVRKQSPPSAKAHGEAVPFKDTIHRARLEIGCLAVAIFAGVNDIHDWADDPDHHPTFGREKTGLVSEDVV